MLADCEGTPDVIIIATGSEVHLALEAKNELSLNVRVVSMPSWELFEQQDAAYRDEVLPPSVTARIAVEAGATIGWHKWVGSEGRVIGIDRFGTSAPADVAFEKYGFTADEIARHVREMVIA